MGNIEKENNLNKEYKRENNEVRGRYFIARSLELLTEARKSGLSEDTIKESILSFFQDISDEFDSQKPWQFSWDVENIAKEKGFKSILGFSKKSGLGYNTVHEIWNGSAKRIGLDVLKVICEILECDPNDILKKTNIKDS